MWMYSTYYIVSAIAGLCNLLHRKLTEITNLTAEAVIDGIDYNSIFMVKQELLASVSNDSEKERNKCEAAFKLINPYYRKNPGFVPNENTDMESLLPEWENMRDHLDKVANIERNNVETLLEGTRLIPL